MKDNERNGTRPPFGDQGRRLFNSSQNALIPY